MVEQQKEETAHDVDQEMRIIRRYLKKHPRFRRKLIRMIRKRTDQQGTV